MSETINKRSIMLVTRNFPPLLGGMEKLNHRLLKALEVEWRLALCGPAGCSGHVDDNVLVREAKSGSLSTFLWSTFLHAVGLARQIRPTWVVAGSGLTAPIAWFAARCVGARMAVYLHGLDIVVPSRIYRWLWLPFVRKADLVLVNSTHTADLAAKHGMAYEKIHVLNPGTDMPDLDAEMRQRFRDDHALGSAPVLLSVGRLTERKGLAEFVAESLPQIVATYPEAILLVIGNEAVNALHARRRSEREHIEGVAASHGVAEHVRFLGSCDEPTLAAAYQAADLHVFPVLDLPGDVEGFGMVALESAAYGLSTVAFSVGGVPDAVQDGVSGSLVASGDYPAMSQAVISYLSQPKKSVFESRHFAEGKAWPEFGRRLRKLLDAYQG